MFNFILIFLFFFINFFTNALAEEFITENNDYTFSLDIGSFETLTQNLATIQNKIAYYKNNMFILNEFTDNDIVFIKVILQKNSFYLIYTVKNLTLQGFINYNNEYYYFSNSIIKNIPSLEVNKNLNFTIKNLPTNITISFPKIINTFYNLSQYSGTTNILQDLSCIIYLSSMSLKSKLVLKTLESIYEANIEEGEYTKKINIYNYLINNKKWINLSKDVATGDKTAQEILNIINLNQ